ncbi:MAG: homoserine dehydrogenase [Gammaproteobacteria bacterium]|nr:homoserine dehydrogenase [Gammaproteobacteria bacterium]NIN60914.1 homoserine dehydrogenase [Gammaproteobacteria bacterium]NIO62538.1 homoserine dehydrogenase [Gammaproteobacteria bacterium]NIP49545.1 homoserine dehydrogenase [Gammaproteobacteria bacterium]NIQ10769.1 homoserine dehydrogenase [Gammaproteobacteria bacterium]
MEPVKVGLLGLGIVGGGTISVLRRNATEIARRAGRGIIITHASARDLKKPREFSLDGIELLGDPLELVNHPEVEIVAELIGGTELARELVMQAISNGKHVVTANKALIAIHGNEIFEAATRKGVIVAFEAAVAGGIPIIKAIREGLAGNSISSVAGIINGTTNFILTAMREQARSFEDVLAEAQSLGYAEANPTFDVEGIDAAHKLTILAAIAFGIPLQFEKVFTEGITQITIEDIGFAERFGYRIRHLGIARRTSEGVELRVHPTLIPERRLIANVDGVRNAVLVIGDAVGPTIYYGAGAGADPTASAVVADLVDIVRAFTTDPGNRVPHLAFQSDALSYEEILPMEEISTAYYLRMQALDRPGVLADVTRILGESGISIEAILQREPVEGASFVPIIILTQSVQEKYMNQAIEKLEALPNINGRIMRIRMDPLA